MPTPTLTALYRIIEEEPLRRKILIVRSFAAGHQWVQRMARTFGAVQQVEVHTVESLALEAARLKLFEGGRRYVSREESRWLIMSLMTKLGQAGDDYVPTAMVTPGVAEAFHNAVCELREAGLTSARIEPNRFERPEKGAYVRRLLQAYEEALERDKLIDFAHLFRYAEPMENGLLLLDPALRLSAAGDAVLKALAGRIVVLPDNEPFTDPNSGFPYQTLAMFRAAGTLAEPKEAFRRIAAQRLAWDQVEIILSDYAACAPKVHALARSLDVPCTFAQGLPFLAGSIGKAALAALEWMESDFRAETLIAAFRRGLLRLPSEEIKSSDAVRVLETSGIGWGRERYALLREYASDQENLAACARQLEETVSEWFAALPVRRSDWSCAHVADALARWVECCREPAGRSDADALQTVRELRETTRRWGDEPVGASTAIRLVREQLESKYVEAEGIPKPGSLFISSLENGGQSGRPFTFILGMDEESWALSIRQDPVLLDAERRALNEAAGIPELLETSGRRAVRRQDERDRRLGGIRGTVTASFTGLRLSDQKEGSPAYELLQLYRLHCGNGDADFDALFDALPEPAIYFGGLTDLNIYTTDYLLGELSTKQHTLRDGRSSVLAVYSLLSSGAAAVESRQETLIGAYDGVLRSNVVEEGISLQSYSASKLETYAKCPLLFFYQELLGIRPKETAVYDRSRWLDPLQRGSLLHRIFFVYMNETVAAGGEHDRDRLDRIAERLLQETLQAIPAPSAHVYEKECASIRGDVEVFYHMELRRGSRPAYFELELHADGGTFALELSDGFVLPLRGVVDRIDETAPHRYRVIDYKTGNPKSYDDGSFYAGGKQVQHALYALAVEQWLRRTGRDPEAVVDEAGYAFPTARGMGEEAMRAQLGKREETERLLRSAVEAIRSGLFPPADDPKVCAYCDYAAVCGPHAEWKKGARNFPENRERLAPLLEVTRHG
ncbi:PD-(D/E)XK nuclease family protein [Paenibacillus sp.]|uniref:PD-(D/E)XK nuclease family protein n=1 Tax=Paenibacillus sp. TaxID=58172 RepID=UPI002D4CDD98|nr:PD-(D/E)XK nuclease family protein [Paenibacillus sp.]HZG87853.1 PD-(D/E)XK nuclease family protein [Paenibacillus sp.]